MRKHNVRMASSLAQGGKTGKGWCCMMYLTAESQLCLCFVAS